MRKKDTLSNSKKRLIKANKTTVAGALLNIALSLVKISAGIFGHSQAMIADGIHSISDLGSDIIVITGMFLASRPKDNTHNYGHGKYETLSALIISIILTTIGIGIGYSSIIKAVEILSYGQTGKPHLLAFVAALTSIIIKEGLYRYTIKKGREINSPALIANAYHHRSDAFSSLGTALGIGGAILLGNNWVILDPIAGVVVSLIIIAEAIHIGIISINELLEVSLPLEIQNEILQIAASIPEVHKPHNLKTRRIGNTFAIDLHILINSGISIEKGHSIAHRVEEEIKSQLGSEILFSIHMEPYRLP